MSSFSSDLFEDAVRAGGAGLWRWVQGATQVQISRALLYPGDGAVSDLVPLDEELLRTLNGSGVFERFVEALQSGSEVDEQLDVVAPGGRQLRLRLRGRRSWPRGANVPDLVGLASEIAAVRSPARRQVTATGGDIGTWEVARGQPYVTWSAEVYDFFGVSPDSYQPRLDNFVDLFHPDDRSRVGEIVGRLFRDLSGREGRLVPFRARVLRPDGSIRHCEVTGYQKLDAAGRAIGACGEVQDVTQLAEAEHRLFQAQKQEIVSRFSGGVSHDFNNLLSVILGSLELIRDSASESERLVHIESATAAALRGRDLTRKLLAFARRADLEPGIVELNGIIGGMRGMLDRLLPEAIAVEIRMGKDLWPVYLDAANFENAVINLVVNGREAMEGAGRLSIETENRELAETCFCFDQETLPPGRYVVVSVTDNGTGIRAERLADLFLPFVTTKPTAGGSGLGLPMVQGFVSQSGGCTRIYSEPGRGTTVSMFFPVAAEAVRDSEKESSRSEALLSGRVLLVEDEPLVMQILERRLQGLGLDCVAAGSGAEALRLFGTEGPFDLLLTDVVMPGAIQGTGLATHLRREQPDLPVIFMSGYPNEEAMRGAAASPDDIRLMKPISRAELVVALNRALARRGVVARAEA